MVAINALVTHRGDTILIRGFELPVLGNTDVTLESLAAGATIGLRVVVVVLAFGVYSACVDPDRVLRALRPVARRSAMTAGLVTRMVPLAAADGGAPARGGEPARPGCRAGGPRGARPAPGRGLPRPGGRRRGHARAARALPRRPAAVRRERSRDDAPVLLTGMAILTAAVAARIAGRGRLRDLSPDPAGDGPGDPGALPRPAGPRRRFPSLVRRWRSRG